MEDNKTLDRSDGRWAHPLLRDGWPEDNEQSLGMFMGMYRTDMTDEEHAAIVAQADAMNAMFDKAPLPEGYPAEKAEFCEERIFEIASADGTPFRTWAFVPKGTPADAELPVVLYLPGGGLIQSNINMQKNFALDIAYATGAVVVAPNYRTMPKVYYPVPLDDCASTLSWVRENPENLPIDTDNITVGGISSGAHLALCLGFRAKRMGVALRGIVAYGPIADYRSLTLAERYRTYKGDWTGDVAGACGAAYLSKLDDPAKAGPEAFADLATVEECVGFAPTTIVTVEYDPGRDSSRSFFEKLLEAEVPAEYHCFAGASHSSSAIIGEGTAIYYEVVDYVVAKAYENYTKYDCRRPWLG